MVCGICDTARSSDAQPSEANQSLETVIILSDDDDLPAAHAMTNACPTLALNLTLSEKIGKIQIVINPPDK